jgi:membrane associated rhomboid family serine protease
MRQQQTWLGDLWSKAFRSGSPLFALIGVNVLVFVALKLFTLGALLTGNPNNGESAILPYITLPYALSDMLYKPWTLISYGFVHVDFFHLLFNLLWFYWLGQIFLSYLQKRQFLFVYVGGILTGGLLYLGTGLLLGANPTLHMGSGVIGSSAGVIAIIFATATLLPDYNLRLLFFGNVPLKFLAIAYLVLDILFLTGMNAGGSVAHMGGALLGFVFIKALRKGNDWSKWIEKRKKSPLKVVRNPQGSAPKETHLPNQSTIDSILDKISKSGYEGLSATEKEALFKASRTQHTKSTKRDT